MKSCETCRYYDLERRFCCAHRTYKELVAICIEWEEKENNENEHRIQKTKLS